MAPIEDAEREHRPRDATDDVADGDDALSPPSSKRVRFSTVVPSNDVTQLTIGTSCKRYNTNIHWQT